MPHQCTTCGHVFDDGSKEMLSGCPDCGGNTFQFHAKGTEIPETPPDADPPEPDGSTTANTVGRAATKVRDFVSSGDGASGGTGENAGSEPATASGPDPNAAWPSEREPQQAGGADITPDDDGIIDADAREASRAAAEATETAPDETAPAESVSAGAAGDAGSTPASTDSGPGGERDGPGEGHVVSEPDDDQPDIAELREQLNDQFESIKILEPGQYELNLMELYDREEYIIALQENGRYVIQVPEQWLGDQPGDA